jgi:hypothetical protein
MNQLLTTLRFYSTGGHLQSIADYCGMHVSTVSRIIVRVSRTIADLYNMYSPFFYYSPMSLVRIKKST